MRKYDSKAGSAARTEFGVELSEGLKAFPETSPLAVTLEDVNGKLDLAYALRCSKAKTVARLRARLGVAEFRAEIELRTFARAVEVVDGGRYGRLYETLFPEGLAVVLRPSRAKQVHALDLILEALGRVATPGVDVVRTQWTARLEAVRGDLQTAVTEFAAASAEHQAAFRDELRLRVEHERLVDQIVGQVRAAFPRDRARQNAVFPARPAALPAPAEPGDVAPPAPTPSPALS